VVETPSEDDGHAKDIALLCALRDGATLPAAVPA
jgi:deoxyribonuclease-4